MTEIQNPFYCPDPCIAVINSCYCLVQNEPNLHYCPNPTISEPNPHICKIAPSPYEPLGDLLSNAYFSSLGYPSGSYICYTNEKVFCTCLFCTYVPQTYAQVINPHYCILPTITVPNPNYSPCKSFGNTKFCGHQYIEKPNPRYCDNKYICSGGCYNQGSALQACTPVQSNCMIGGGGGGCCFTPCYIPPCTPCVLPVCCTSIICQSFIGCPVITQPVPKRKSSPHRQNKPSSLNDTVTQATNFFANPTTIILISVFLVGLGITIALVRKGKPKAQTVLVKPGTATI